LAPVECQWWLRPGPVANPEDAAKADLGKLVAGNDSWVTEPSVTDLQDIGADSCRFVALGGE
jgi:hypothetical protein